MLSGLESKIIQEIRRISDHPMYSGDVQFSDLGFDFVDYAYLTFLIEQEYGQPFSYDFSGSVSELIAALPLKSQPVL